MRRPAASFFRAAALLTCAAALLLFMLVYQLPDTAWGAALQNLGHVPLFGAISGLFLALLRERSFAAPPHRGRAYLAAFAGTIAVGALAELVQHFLPERTASLADLARDALGAGSLLATLATFDGDLRETIPWNHPVGRWAVRGGALAALAAVSAPLLPLARDYAGRDRAFPELLSFEQDWEGTFLILQTAELVAIPPPPGAGSAPDGERVARLTFLPEAAQATEFRGYSGFFIDEPHPDWRGYRTLCLRVFLEEAAPLALSLRVEDAAHQRDNTPGDRFNADFLVEPGWNEIRIPLASIESAPRTRRMDLSRIRIVHLFVVRPSRRYSVLLDDWRLE